MQKSMVGLSPGACAGLIFYRKTFLLIIQGGMQWNTPVYTGRHLNMTQQFPNFAPAVPVAATTKLQADRASLLHDLVDVCY